MHPLATVLLASVGFLVPAAAQAVIAEAWGLQLPARFVDFGTGTFADGTPITTQYPGITFSNASYFTAAAPNNNVAGGYIARNVTTPGLPDRVNVRFATSVYDVTFVYHQVGTGTTTIKQKYQGFVVDVFTIAWNETQPNNFFGFLTCLSDEVEIDFVGDFRIDQIAYNPNFAADCLYHGSVHNPAGFACATLPILGGTWHATIANEPNTVATALVYSPVGLLTPTPLFGGDLLVDPSQGLVAFVGSTDYTFAIPWSGWVGAMFAFQGVRLDVVGGTPTFVPLNAMLVKLGL